jgi:lysozyme
MKASEKLYALTKTEEGLRLKAYRCAANKITIGWGHTSNVRPGQTITIEEAVNMLNDDVASVEMDLNGYFKCKNVVLKQGQFDALVDFCFNVGFPKFRGSTLCKVITVNPNDPNVFTQFKRWVYADGSHNGKDDDGDGIVDEPGEMQALSDLVKRRQHEINLYLS